MQFLNPSFLWALFAISIPILIHLFYFRRFKKVYFPNIEFLKEIKEETSTRNRLKNLLILLLRILTIIALVFAFAQAIIPPPGDQVQKGNFAVSIFVDNSFSMSALGKDISLLEKSKQDAIQVVKAYNSEDQFQVLTNNLKLSQRRWLSQEEAISKLESIDITHNVNSLAKIMRLQRESFEFSEAYNKVIYCLSDFQKTIVDIDYESLDSTIEYNTIIEKSVQEKNVSIDSCWWVAPLPVLGQKSSLIVKLTNHDLQDAENIALSLHYDDQQLPLGKLNIPGGKSVFDTVQLKLRNADWNEARLEISDYPVVFDDHYWIAFDVSDKIEVLLLSEKTHSKYIEAAFETSNIFLPELKQINSIDYSSLSRYKLVVLEDIERISSGLSSVLKNYVEHGGNVVLFPGLSADIENLNDFLQAFGTNKLRSKENATFEVGFLNKEEFVFSNVFDEKQKANIEYPKVEQRYLLTAYYKSKARKLIGFKDGKSFLETYGIGKGNFYLSTVPLDVSVNNLVKRAELFVPMLYRMSLSSNLSDNLAYTIGRDELIRINRQIEHSDIPFKITGKKEFIPGLRNIGSVVQLNLAEQMEEAGIYTISHDEMMQKKLAFNYDRRESDLSIISEEELNNIIGDKGNVYSKIQTGPGLKDIIIAKEKGITLWKWFIILALLFIGMEILLLRIFKS